jgi:hypothetical protein
MCAITGKILIEKCEFVRKHGVTGEFGHKFGEQLTGRLVLAFADQCQCDFCERPKIASSYAPLAKGSTASIASASRSATH